MQLRLISELVHGHKAVPYTTGHYDVCPDDFYNKPGAVPFIYHEDGTLFTGGNRDTHLDLMVRNAPHYGLEDWGYESFTSLQQDYLKGRKNGTNIYDDTYKSALAIRKQMQREPIALLGRVGSAPSTDRDRDDKQDGDKMVAFWNDLSTPAKMPHLVAPCLKELFRQGIISLNDIYAYGTKQMSVRNYLRGGRFHASPEEDEQKALMQQLHLMPPQEKKAAMKKLKLAGGGHTQPWQQATNKHVKPGQKWWAMQSESNDSQD